MQLSLGLTSSSLRLVVLGSGSSGNSLVIESAGRRLMVDAGFSCRELERRLARVGLASETFDGLVLTHEHTDHVRGARRFVQRNGVAVYATAGTLQAPPLSGRVAATVLRPGVPREVGSFVVFPFLVPHDAREPIGLVIEDAEGHRVGVVADLGSRSARAWAALRDLDVLVIETNHDVAMLQNGPYPWSLKRRVASHLGHLSNRDAARGLRELLNGRLRAVVLYHLSRVNNMPALAEETMGEVLEREGSAAALTVSSQFKPTRWIELEEATACVRA